MTASKTHRRLLTVVLFTAIAALTVTPGARSAQQTIPQVVSSVDLDRYIGTWYEIAHIPNRFQRHCRGNTMASYRRIPQQRIEVINSCVDEHGAVDKAHGVARIVDSTSNAKLEVSFVALFGWQLFWGDYWILALAPDYSYAVVGTPDRRFGWLLSRTPVMPAETRNRINKRLRESGYDPRAFIDTPQEIGDSGSRPTASDQPGR